MKRLISASAALKVMLIVFCVIVLFHVLVVVGVIPYNIVWGGRLNSRLEMLNMEAVSLSINTVLIIIILWRMGKFKWKFHSGVARILFWLMFVLFVLNTVGNLASESKLEMAIFTPLTLVLALCSLRVALD